MFAAHFTTYLVLNIVRKIFCLPPNELYIIPENSLSKAKNSTLSTLQKRNLFTAMEIRMRTTYARVIYSQVRMPVLVGCIPCTHRKTTVRIIFAIYCVPGVCLRDNNLLRHHKMGSFVLYNMHKL